jgi:hypothetical protein
MGLSTPKCNKEDAMTRNYVGDNLFTSTRDGSSESSPERDVYTDPLSNNPVQSTAVKVDGLKYNTKTGKLEEKD